ncbi:MAG: ATP-dependent RNA helicase HrpA, partial [Thermoguttaceae bacterium]
IDEAHERSLNIDFLIGLLKRLLPSRPDLKLIITSATIDAQRFAEHFASQKSCVPIIEVSGRVYPVEVRYCPLVAEDEDEEDADWPCDDLTAGVLGAVEELARIDNGDMLIFMPTERDIHETAKALRGRMLPGDSPGRQTEILPLYARLPGSEQQRIFRPHGRRRIVIATNVAESSLTVPGIRYVIDPGTARISRYSARSKTQRLPIEAISRASADQRKGRCGRVGPGICVRLYSEEDFERRDRFTMPEIQRSNLASVILQARALRLGDLERFPFLDPPKTATIRDGYKTLFELKAVDKRKELTPLGRRLAALPVDPRIGRMIFAGDEEGCLSEVLIIASALEVRDPRERPIDKQQAADTAHAKFIHEESDFLTYLNLWDFYHGLRKKLSRNQLRRACRQNFLNYNRMREWVDIHRQLLQLADQAGLERHGRKNEYEPIHRAILSGVLANVANRTGNYEYTAAGGTKFHLWPGSTVFSKKPKWIMAAELLETGRRYLRCSARINPQWIEPIAGHLVNRSFSEPHWNAKSGSAMAFERVSLFGLIVVPRRHVALGPIDPTTARELLIRHGLVDGELRTNAPFFEHNRELVVEMERLQKKLRRHDLLSGLWAQIEFFDKRLPDDVFDAARLDKWRKKAEREDPRILFYSKADLVQDEDQAAVDPADYPDAIDACSTQLAVDYEFEPGSDDDGIHLIVPLEQLGSLDPGRPDWLVPGLMRQKVTALIKSLPKPLRRLLVPAPDMAARITPVLRHGEGDMLRAVADALSRECGQRIRPQDFQLDSLPRELQMNIRVVDADNEPIASGRDLDELRKQVGGELAETLAAAAESKFSRDGLTDWDFLDTDELPERVSVPHGTRMLTGFPMLVDRGDSVSLRLSDSIEQATRETRRGIARLFCLATRRELQSQVGWLPGLEQMSLHAASLRDFDLRRNLAALIASRAMEPSTDIPRSRAEFDAVIEQATQRIGAAVQEVSLLVPSLFEAYHAARLALDQAKSPRWQYAVADMRAQLEQLTLPDFLSTTPWHWLQHYPRYFRAICYRLDGLRSGSPQRDRAACEEVRARWDAYRQCAIRHEEMRRHDEHLAEMRWMLEEYRVSLFAQKLGTSIRISGKRLDRQWELIEHPV